MSLSFCYNPAMKTKKKKTPSKPVIALEVFLNGKKLALAGASDLAVLTATITAVGKLGPESAGSQTRPKSYSIDFRVGGLISKKIKKVDLDWVDSKRLKLGDEVLVRVLKTERPDMPARIRSIEPFLKYAEKEEFEWV